MLLLSGYSGELACYQQLHGGWWECLCLVTTAWPEDEQGFIPGQLPLLLGGPRAGQKKSWIGWTKPHTNTWWVINDIALQPTMSWFKQKLQRRFAVISVIVTPVAGSLHGGWRVDILNTSAGPGRWRWEEETSTKAVLLVQAVVRRRPRPIYHLSISLPPSKGRRTGSQQQPSSNTAPCRLVWDTLPLQQEKLQTRDHGKTSFEFAFLWSTDICELSRTSFRNTINLISDAAAYITL